MDLYNQVILSTNELLTGKHKVWQYSEQNVWQQTATNEIVMLRDTAFELGGGNKKAVSFNCATTDGSLVSKDEILLYGRDLCDMTEDCSYARIVFLQVEDAQNEDEAYNKIKDIDFVKYSVFPRGFMIRASAVLDREQVRVSKYACESEISFEKVGNLFINAYKQFSFVKAVKIIFITDELIDFKVLEKSAKKIDSITKALNHIMDGLDFDCHTCKMKPICDEVEGMKELHIKSIG